MSDEPNLLDEVVELDRKVYDLTAERDEWRRKYESIVATLSAYCNSATNPTTHQVVFNVLRKHGERA